LSDQLVKEYMETVLIQEIDDESSRDQSHSLPLQPVDFIAKNSVEVGPCVDQSRAISTYSLNIESGESDRSSHQFVKVVKECVGEESVGGESDPYPLCSSFQSSPEIIRQIVRSNFLNYREMGRLLLFVSKSTTALGFSYDDAWEALLINRFGLTIAFDMMNSLKCGPHRCFKHLIKTEPRRSKPIRFTSNDYRIIINVYDENGERIIFRIADGENVDQFFNNGFVSIKGDKGLKNPVYARYSGLYRTKATVHIIRIPDQKSICIIDDLKGLSEYSLERKHFVYTTSACPSASPTMIDDNASKLLNTVMESSRGIYFNLRMKIRKTTSRDNCSGDYNVALYGNIVLEAVIYPSCALFKDERDGDHETRFADILERFRGWSVSQ